MNKSNLWVALPATFMVALSPISVEALDLGKSARSISRSVSKTVSGALGGSRSSKSPSTSGNKSGTSVSVGGTSVSLGSGSRGGLGVSVNSSLLGGTKADVDLLGKNSVADVSVESGVTGRANVGVLSRGQLATLGIDSNPSRPGTPGGSNGPGAISPDYVKSMLADMNRIEQQAFRLRCKDVLRSPKAFDAELIQLCQILATI